MDDTNHSAQGFPLSDPPIDYIYLLRDNSMSPILPQGTVVFVKSQKEMENGELGIFEVNGEMICRRFRRLESHLLLEPFNEAYQVQLLQFCESPRARFRIIGKVYHSS